jgi:hypothetical protein
LVPARFLHTLAGRVMETDTIGLVVLVAALAALFIAAKLSRCRKVPTGQAGLPRFHFFNVESFIKRS